MAAEDHGNNYTNGILKIADQTIDFLNDTIKVLIVDGSHVFDKTDVFVADIVANELSGTGYERKTLANKSIATTVGTPDEVRFDADNVEYTEIDAGTMANAIIYKEVTNDADSILITQAAQPTITTIGTDIRLEWPDEGVFYITNPIVTA